MIDFLTGPFNYRLRHLQKKELLAKAIGINSSSSFYVIDATAGLGRDGFLLAVLGCRVLMLERSAVLATELKEGLEVALQDPSYQHLQIRVLHTDAKDFLRNLNPIDYPDVIYLDPMFPEKKKTALVKKEMQSLQSIIGQDEDADLLFTIALEKAKKRVVVKRPQHASPLANKKPHHTIVGKKIRFDVY